MSRCGNEASFSGEFRSQASFLQLLVKIFSSPGAFWLLFCRHKKVTRLAGRDPHDKDVRKEKRQNQNMTFLFDWIPAYAGMTGLEGCDWSRMRQVFGLCSF